MVRADLDAARAAWIRATKTPQERREREASSVLAYQDDRGGVFDFHSLRHQYISNLASAGVHPKMAQTLARHSTITLTLGYTHAGQADLVTSVNNLPSIPVKSPNEELRAPEGDGNRKLEQLRGAHSGAERCRKCCHSACTGNVGYCTEFHR
jgi:hypothetical protein